MVIVNLDTNMAKIQERLNTASKRMAGGSADISADELTQLDPLSIDKSQINENDHYLSIELTYLK